MSKKVYRINCFCLLRQEKGIVVCEFMCNVLWCKVIGPTSLFDQGFCVEGGGKKNHSMSSEKNGSCVFGSLGHVTMALCHAYSDLNIQYMSAWKIPLQKRMLNFISFREHFFLLLIKLLHFHFSWEYSLLHDRLNVT